MDYTFQPDHTYSTAQAAALLGVKRTTLRSRKSRAKTALIEGLHWQSLNGKTCWTTTGILEIARRTQTPEAAALLEMSMGVGSVEAPEFVSSPGEIKASSPLSQPERQLFIETLSGKLPQSEVQRLLQQMDQVEETMLLHVKTPSVQRSCLKSRCAIAIVVFAVIASGGIWLSRSGIGATHSNPPATLSAIAPLPLDSSGAIDTVEMTQALGAAEQQQRWIDTLRRNYLLAQAERERQSKGTPVQQWLMRHLNRQREAMRRTVGTHPSGDAQHIAIARSIAGETKATLLALQFVAQPTHSASRSKR
jgi:hypothetical protein